MSSELKPRQDFLDTALACGATLTGKPDGSEAITVVFAIDAWRKFDTAIQQAEKNEPVGEVQTFGDNGVCDEVRLYAPLPWFTKVYTHPAPGVPDGCALVPIEPTDEMLNAALKFESQGSGIQGGDLVDVWKAMLAAKVCKAPGAEG